MSHDYRVEEYKALRSEILRNMEAAERNIVACLTANGVALAYGVKEGKVLVLLLACLIPIYFWIQHTFFRQAIAKIGSYIAVFIESSDVCLMWENRLNLMELAQGKPRVLYALKSLLLPYPILLMVSALTTFITQGKDLRVEIIIGGSTALILSIGILAKKADIQYVDLRAKWLTIFHEAREAEERQRERMPALRVVNEAPNTGPQADAGGAA
jgi:hypothetical protein